MKSIPTKVLLVEDNAGDARLVEEAFRDIDREGFDIVHVSRLSEAISHLAREAMDVVLLDLSLPDANGPETISKLGKQVGTVPIVVLTGHNNETLGLEAIHHGAQDYLVKGTIDGKRLVHSVRYAIERNRIVSQLKEFDRLKVGVFFTDHEGRCQYVNKRWTKITGLTLEIAQKEGWEVSLHPDDRETVSEEWQKRVKEKSPFRMEYRFQRSDGITTWVLAQADPEVGDSGDIIGYAGTLTNITQRKAAESALNQFKNTLDRTLDCIFMFDPITLKFFYVNQGAMNQVGYNGSELFHMTPLDIEPEFNETQFRKTISPLLDGSKPSLTFQTLHRHKDGTDIPVEVFLQYISLQGENPRFLAIVRDITERKKAEEVLANQALHDPLTNLYNRRYFNRRIVEEIARANRNQQVLAILLCDLDNFKSINDRQGHQGGMLHCWPLLRAFKNLLETQM